MIASPEKNNMKRIVNINPKDRGRVPFTSNTPIIYGVDWAIGSVVRRMEHCRDKSIRLQSDSGYHWDAKKKSLLIESLILGIPIQPITLALAEDDVYDILDGRERLSTIKQFFDNEFTLTGLTIREDLNNRGYAEIGESDVLNLNWQPIRVNLIEGWHNQEILDEIRCRIA